MKKLLITSLITFGLSQNVYAEDTNKIISIIAKGVVKALELKNQYSKIDELRIKYPKITFYPIKIDGRGDNKPFNQPLIFNNSECLLEVDVLGENGDFIPDDHELNDLCVLSKFDYTFGMEGMSLVDFANKYKKDIIDKIKQLMPGREIVEE